MNNQDLKILWRLMNNSDTYYAQKEAIEKIIDEIRDDLKIEHFINLTKTKLKQAAISVEVIIALDQIIEKINQETAQKILQKQINKYYGKSWAKNRRFIVFPIN